MRKQMAFLITLFMAILLVVAGCGSKEESTSSALSGNDKATITKKTRLQSEDSSSEGRNNIIDCGIG